MLPCFFKYIESVCIQKLNTIKKKELAATVHGIIINTPTWNYEFQQQSPQNTNPGPHTISAIYVIAEQNVPRLQM
jgi:hypothetical protein